MNTLLSRCSLSEDRLIHILSNINENFTLLEIFAVDEDLYNIDDIINRIKNNNLSATLIKFMLDNTKFKLYMHEQKYDNKIYNIELSIIINNEVINNLIEEIENN